MKERMIAAWDRLAAQGRTHGLGLKVTETSDRLVLRFNQGDTCLDWHVLKLVLTSAFDLDFACEYELRTSLKIWQREFEPDGSPLGGLKARFG
jgi:hypothetical protein